MEPIVIEVPSAEVDALSREELCSVCGSTQEKHKLKVCIDCGEAFHAYVVVVVPLRSYSLSNLLLPSLLCYSVIVLRALLCCSIGMVSTGVVSTVA